MLGEYRAVILTHLGVTIDELIPFERTDKNGGGRQSVRARRLSTTNEAYEAEDYADGGSKDHHTGGTAGNGSATV
jgi:hypothetical protein